MSRREGLIRPRTEAILLVPAALLVLVAVSFFVLFAYREAVVDLLAARGTQAENMAHAIATRIDDDAWPQQDRLRAWAPEAWAMALLDAARVPTVTVGDLSPRPVRAGTEGWSVPRDPVDDIVSAEVAIESATRRGFVRVDLAAPDAVRRVRSLRLLVPTVVIANLGLVGLLLIYFRRLIGGFDALVARARRAATGSGHDDLDPVRESHASEDDLAVLVRAIDQALGMPEPGDGNESGTSGALAAFGRAVNRGLEGGVLLLDDQGHVVAASIASATMLGIEQPERRVPLTDALAAHPSLVAVLEDAVAGRRDVRREACTIESPEGPRTVGLTANPLWDDESGRAGLMVLIADLTAERRRRDRARLADRLAHVGALAAGVAHEMRNSLATLRGYIDLAARSDDPVGTGLITELSGEASHLEGVVEDFLHFARPGNVRPETLDIVALARRAAADPSLAPTRVDVRVEPATARPEEATIVADPSLLLRAVRNLLRNAHQAHAESAVPEKPGATLPILVTIRLGSEDVTLTIDDHGAGLGDHDPETLFDPFMSGRNEGTGLGLAITRRIVLLHGGEIALENRPEGGARAQLVLPRSDASTLETDALGNGTGVTKRNESSGEAFQESRKTSA